MGEEFEGGNLMLYGPDGKGFRWDGLKTAEIVPSEEDKANEPNELYATLQRNASMEFTMEATISKSGYFWLMLGNRQLVRRALRWYEKLRRIEVKKNIKLSDKLFLAVQCAMYKSDN